MAAWNSKTNGCIKFIKRTNQAAYASFFRGSGYVYIQNFLSESWVWPFSESWQKSVTLQSRSFGAISRYNLNSANNSRQINPSCCKWKKVLWPADKCLLFNYLRKAWMHTQTWLFTRYWSHSVVLLNYELWSNVLLDELGGGNLENATASHNLILNFEGKMNAH